MNHITQFLISYGGIFLFLVGFAEQSGLPFPGAPWVTGSAVSPGLFEVLALVGRAKVCARLVAAPAAG